MSAGEQHVRYAQTKRYVKVRRHVNVGHGQNAGPAYSQRLLKAGYLAFAIVAAWTLAKPLSGQAQVAPEARIHPRSLSSTPAGKMSSGRAIQCRPEPPAGSATTWTTFRPTRSTTARSWACPARRPRQRRAVPGQTGTRAKRR